MAGFVEKVETAHLNCSICLDTFTDPKQLQCHHVFCKKCLVNLVVQDQLDQPVLTCPKCRQVTPVPASGVSGLQAAFDANKLLDLVKEEKTVSNDKVECPEHGRKEMELYCKTCGEIICFKCIMIGEKHHSHEYKELSVIKKEATLLLKPAEDQLTTITKALKLMDARYAEIANQQATTEAAIEDNIEETKTELCKILDARKAYLKDHELHQLTRAKFSSLEAQREHLETSQEELSSSLQFIQENLELGSQGMEKLVKSTTVDRVKELTTAIQPDILEPDTEADVAFSSSVADQVLAECQTYGKLHAPGTPDPTNCNLTGQSVDAVTAGEKFSVTLQAINFHNKPCREWITSITSELVSEITKNKVPGNIERKGQGQYEISCQPTIKGKHQLHIKVDGQHIKESPLTINVHLPVEMLDTPILTIDKLNRPHDIAVNRRGEMVVTNRKGHQISVFRPFGEKFQAIGDKGSDEEHFEDPFGLALDEEDNILVTDCDNHRIQKFTAQGKFITAVGIKGQGRLEFWRPRGITVNACNGRVYMVDGTNRRIQILNPDLTYYSHFGGKEGNGEGEFDKPRHVACDSKGNVYVTDSHNHRIQVFTAEGKFLKIFKTCDWELKEPYGLAIDSSDNVYVSVRGISVFHTEGQLLKSFGSWGSGPGEFKYPGGLAVSSSGVVYVCDCSNHRVTLFQSLFTLS